MKICAGSQAKQSERRRCVIAKVKNHGMTPESALSACLNGSQRSYRLQQTPGAAPG